MMGLGYLPDEADERDREYALSGEHLPLSADAAANSCEELFATDPLYQNGHNSCVPQAVAQAVYAAHVRAGHAAPPLLSRHGLWSPCRFLAGTHKQNAGTSFRNAFKVMNKVGFCEEKYHPHDLRLGKDAPFRHAPPTRAQQLMTDQIAPKEHVVYRRLYETGEERIPILQQCIDNRLPPVFGTEVDEAFVRGHFDPEVPLTGPSGTLAGGHGMIVGGYRGDAFRVRSSWGRWANNGWCWMAAEYVERWRDIWVVDAAPWFTSQGE